MRVNWWAIVTLPIVTVVVWQVVIWVLQPAPYLLPPPAEVLGELLNPKNRYLFHAWITARESATGFLIANLIAFVVGVLISEFRSMQRFVFPYAVALKTTPIVAVAPLLFLWFGGEFWTKVAAAALICFFPVLVTVVRGMELVDDEMVELFDTLQATRWQKLVRLRLPNATPHIFAGLKVSSSLSVVGAIVGEFVSPDKGLGHILVSAGVKFETARVFAALILAALIGIVFFKVVELVEARVLRWRPETDAQL